MGMSDMNDSAEKPFNKKTHPETFPAAFARVGGDYTLKAAISGLNV